MRWVALLLFCMSLWGLEVPKNGDKILPITLKNQHGNEVSVNQIQKIVYLPDEKAFDLWKSFMKERSGAFIDKQGVKVVADLSNAPSFVRSLFILPGLRKLDYEVLVIEDEFSPVIFQSILEQVTVVTVDGAQQKNIRNLGSIEALRVFFKE